MRLLVGLVAGEAHGELLHGGIVPVSTDARSCPSSFEGGCRCPEHYGLREYQLAHRRPDFGLAPALGNLPRPVIRIVGEIDEKPHSMTCTCMRCEVERRQRVRAGSRQIKQPWDLA